MSQPAAYSTTPLVKFSNRLLKHIYEKSVFDSIVNRNYEGEVKGEASQVKIPALAELSWQTYSGSVSYQSVSEIVSTLTLDQKRYIAPKFADYDKFVAFIKNPETSIMDQITEKFRQMVDQFVLAFWGDVASGNWVGTDYLTGTVTVTITTGAVTGSGTTFTSAMVGKPFKAAGHTAWYRVKTFSSTTAIVIEDDVDDVASQYTGGTIGAGAAYVIQANTPVAVSSSNFLTNILTLDQKLNEAEATFGIAVPQEDRWLVIPPVAKNTLLRDAGIKLSVPAAYEGLVQKGFLTELAGFKVFVSSRVAGDNTNGYRVLAGHGNWLTFADGLDKGPETIRLEGDFATGYRELRVYGAKVADERRPFAAQLYATFS